MRTRAADWPIVAIRETYVGLFDGPHATPAPAAEGPVFLGIGNLTEDGHLDLADIRHIDESDVPQVDQTGDASTGRYSFHL